MKKYLLILFIFCARLSFSQQPFSGLVDLDHDTCIGKKFSIVFYVVLDSNYSMGSINSATLSAFIDSLNNRFGRICVSFENCSTVVIPNYPWSKWKKSITDPVVTNNWYTYKTINVYIVDSVKLEPANQEWGGGYTYAPPSQPGDTAKDVIVLEQQTVTNYWPGVFHHFGHYFGLVHTHDEAGFGPPASPGPLNGVISQEYVNGSNCSIHGDCICDTEADPGPTSQVTDGNGQVYLAPLDNFMSIYSAPTRYTQQQYNRMAHIIMTKRLYLH